MPATLAEAKEKLAKGETREKTSAGIEEGVWKPPYTAAASPLPRLIDENERAPAGTTRFKVRGAGEQPTFYILAKDEASAKALYLRTTGLDAKPAGDKGEKADVPVFVRKLDD